MDALAQLHDIHMPGFWPLAVGWYASALLVIFAGFAAFYGYRSYRRRALPRKAALQRLKHLRLRYARDADAVAIAVELSMLLRRSALAKYPATLVAGLKGQSWLQFLDKTGNTLEFSSGVGKALISAPYQQQSRYPVDELFNLIRVWIKTNVKC